MCTITGKNREILAENIRSSMSKVFPGRGCNKRLAELMGVSPRVVSQWINGEKIPSNNEIYHLAQLFKTTPQELCGLSSPCRNRRNINKKATMGQIYACDAIILIAQEQKKVLLKENADIEWEQTIASIMDVIIMELSAAT